MKMANADFSNVSRTV